MKNETRYMLDSLLSEWYQWAKGFNPLGSHSTAPMFQGLTSSRQWDSESDVLDADLHNSQMETVDFHITELCPEHRTAIGIHARNLATGKHVWTSARLPLDLQERQELLGRARQDLTRRLIAAGVL
jgi:hypothetical protein